MFVACGIWCLADVSSVSPSSEQTGYPPNKKVTRPTPDPQPSMLPMTTCFVSLYLLQKIVPEEVCAR